MGSGFIDSFQLLIGIYLLYMGVKGENLGNRLSGVPDQNEVKEPKALRGLYILGAVFALSDFCPLLSAQFHVHGGAGGGGIVRHAELYGQRAAVPDL